MHFTKWQGCGNDFVIIDERENFAGDAASFAKKICDRHYGVGADGLIFVLSSAKADFRMRIINADGSEAEMCGNGIRCFARHVKENGFTAKNEFTVETKAGIIVPKIIEANGETLVSVDMGKPILEGDKIPVKGFGSEKIINETITVAGNEYKMTCVSMGNPHCVIFVDDAENCGIEKLGPLFEHHELFPNKINTEFVAKKSDDRLRMRVWERGAAITPACGTGSCAALVASSLTQRTGRKAAIELDGGTLVVEWKDNDHVFMTGSAEKVFDGNLEENFYA